VWWEPEYRELRLSGWLANAIPPWGMLSAPVEAVVRDPDETPYCQSLGANQYFLLGDNRNYANDSRVFGAVDRNSIKGVLVEIVTPKSRVGRVPGAPER
jgi:hypothetical protein